MQIAGSVALVTGANRGIGKEFVRQLAARGAQRIYATARNPESIEVPEVEVLALDLTDPESIRRAAAQAQDVDILINNAGISTYQPLIAGDLTKIALELNTHFYGTLHVTRAFAPVLAANGGGAILNMLSALSWIAYPGATAYSAAKAAEWSLTDATRLELAEQGTLVTGLHVGAVDTDMMAGWDIPKSTPADVVRAGLDGLEAGQSEVLADEAAEQAKAGLTADPRDRYAALIPTLP